jgi:hypothetical protein
LEKKFRSFVPPIIRCGDTKTSLLSREAFHHLGRFPVLKGRLSKGRGTGSREGGINSENPHDTLENSILGNPIEENTLAT